MHARTCAIAGFVAIALSTGGLVAVAQTTKPADPGMTSGKAKDRRDTNKDGVISDKEKSAAREKARARFNEADRNKDGGLSREEARAARGYGDIEQHFDAMDANKDGKVTPEERRAWRKANPRSGKASSKSGQTSTDQRSGGGGLLPPR
jgi:hypothetical protein